MPLIDKEARRTYQNEWARKRRKRRTQEEIDKKAEYQREWRKRNRGRIKTYSAEAYRRRSKWFLKMKSTLLCCICDMSFKGRTEICDFHHVDENGKSKGIGMMIPSRSKSHIFKEIRKCVPLCTNCHRTLHKGSSKLRAEYKSKVKEVYSKGGLWNELR